MKLSKIPVITLIMISSFFSIPTFASENQTTAKWEYKMVSFSTNKKYNDKSKTADRADEVVVVKQGIDILNELNKLGDKGWELIDTISLPNTHHSVRINEAIYLFKRKKQTL